VVLVGRVGSMDWASMLLVSCGANTSDVILGGLGQVAPIAHELQRRVVPSQAERPF
jgi:hypothetical protein